jgi:hypothetical protein
MLIAPLAALSAFADETPFAAPVVPKDIKAYCLDFNWGPGGPNGFAQPGLWADADPAQHIAWYRAMGVNVIQTFCVSCNGYAWYKNGVAPEQPGLQQDFLPEVVKHAHGEGMLALGYFCAGANTRWGQTRPELSYGFPSEPHIPYTDEYLAYLDAVIRDAIGKTGIDGFMLDWLRMPTSRTSNGGRWLDCEKKLYAQLMGEPFPGEQELPAAKMTEYPPTYEYRHKTVAQPLAVAQSRRRTSACGFDGSHALVCWTSPLPPSWEADRKCMTGPHLAARGVVVVRRVMSAAATVITFWA